MGSSDTELRVPIDIPVDASGASKAADSIEQLRDRITASKDAIREAESAMRDLRGKTDEVKAAKDQLKAKVDAERAAVTQASLALVTQGTSYAKLAAQAKVAAATAAELAAAKKEEAKAAKEQEKAAKDAAKKEEEHKKKLAEISKKGTDQMKAQSDAMSRAVAGAGGPVAALKGKIEALDTVLGGSGDTMAAVAGGASLAAAAVLALGGAFAALAYKIGGFVIAGNDANRVMQLTRQANFGGNATWAKNLGDQVDELRRKIPLARDKFNDLGVSLLKARISGKTMQDTMAAVGGASAAAGDDLGQKLEGIVKRGSFTKRMQISPMELMGGDLEFDDVAKAYAKGMNISVEAARAALFEGRVKLADGAAALKKAVEDKFGAINAEKMRTLDALSTKFGDDLKALTKDVDLSPLWKGLEKLEKNFDVASVNGKALKGIIETIGRNIGLTFEGGVPIMQEFIDKAVYGALKIENYWLRAEVAFKKLTKGTRTLGDALGEAATKSLPFTQQPAFITTAAELGEKAGNGIRAIKNAIVEVRTELEETDWEEVGRKIPEGVASGVKDAAKAAIDAVGDLGTDLVDAFRKKLKINSPSKVFEDDSINIPKGTARGVERGAPEAQAAVAAMIPLPGGSGGRGGGGSISITFAPQISVQGGSGDAAEQIRKSGLLEQLWEEFRAQMRAAGIEVPR